MKSFKQFLNSFNLNEGLGGGELSSKANKGNHKGNLRLHILYRKLKGVKDYSKVFSVDGKEKKNLSINYDAFDATPAEVDKEFEKEKPDSSFFKDGVSFKKFIKDTSGKIYSPTAIDKTPDFGGQAGLASTVSEIGLISKDENRAGFYEQWASIGLLMDSGEVKSLDNGDGESFSKVYKKYFGSIDASVKWEDDNHIYYSYVVRRIVQGAQNFITTSPYDKILNSTYTIIHGGIKNYYSKLRTVTDEVEGKSVPRYAKPNSKDNTADIVVVTNGLTVADLSDKNNKMTGDEKGVITVTNENGDEIGKVLQISLKIGHEDAQIGKGITTLSYVPVLDSDGNEKLDADGNVVMVYHSKAKANLLKDLESRLIGQRDENFDAILAEGILSEGILDKLKKFSLMAVEKVKGLLNVAIGRLKKSFSGLLKKITTRSADRYVDSYLKKFKRTHRRQLQEQYPLMEKKGMTNSELIGKIADDELLSSIILEEVNAKKNELGIDVGTIQSQTGGDMILSNISENIDRIDNEMDIKYLICNHMGFDVVNNYFKAIARTGDVLDNALQLSVSLVADTVMGESLLPVIKIYGVEGSSKSYVVLARDDFDEFVSIAKDNNYPGGGIKVVRSSQSKSKSSKGGYYALYLWVFGGLDDRNDPIYFEFQIRTGGTAGGFQFAIEASQDATRKDFENKMK